MLLGGVNSAFAQVLLDRSGWTVTVSSECNDDNAGNGYKAKITDGDINTYWHSNWRDANGTGDRSQELPQFIMVDLGAVKSVQTFVYVPRVRPDNYNWTNGDNKQGVNGCATDYEIYLSDEAFDYDVNTTSNTGAADWYNTYSANHTAVKTGTFTYDNSKKYMWQYATLDAAQNARYVLFVIKGSTCNANFQLNKYANCSEFFISSGNQSTTAGELSSTYERNVTFNYMIGDYKFYSKNLTHYIGQKLTAPSQIGVTNGALSATTCTSANPAVNVTCTFNIPIQTSTLESPVWYAVRMRSSKFWCSTDADEASVAPMSTPNYLDAQHKWAFIGDFFTGFKIYNKGKQQYLKTSGSASTQLTSTFVSDASEATSYTLYGTNQNKENGFCVLYQNGLCLNEISNKLNGWNGIDDGSTLVAIKEAQYPLEYVSRFLSVPENAIQYSYMKEHRSDVQTAYDACNADQTNADKVAALEAVVPSIQGSSMESYDLTSGYYRLYSVPEQKYMAVYKSESNNIMHNDANAAKSASSVFRFVKSDVDGQYYMQVEGLSLGKVTRSQAVNLLSNEDGNKGKYAVAVINDVFFTFQDKTNTNDAQYAYLHVNNGNCVGWEASATKTQWAIVPATDIEVSLNAVGDHTYATTYLPFAVSEVSGAKAYVGAYNDEKTAVNLTKVDGFAANEGVMLYGETTADTKATLTIGGSATKRTDNAFAGTCTEISVAADDLANYLVMGRNSNGEIGFFKPGLQGEATTFTIKANRAYLENSANGTSSVMLNFGSLVEGIGDATVPAEAAKNAPIYDLTGRRVMHTMKGGLYIQNGKKFIVR